MKKPKFKAPNNPTSLAKQIFALAFPHQSWPRYWKVEWQAKCGCFWGWCDYQRKTIVLFHDVAPHHDVLETLIHEMVHMINAGWGLKHGKEFERLVVAAYRRVLGED